MPNITLREFLYGETLRYRGFNRKPTEAIYIAGDGVYVEQNGEEVGKADVIDDASATRAYYNLTRGQSSDD